MLDYDSDDSGACYDVEEDNKDYDKFSTGNIVKYINKLYDIIIIVQDLKLCAVLAIFSIEMYIW